MFNKIAIILVSIIIILGAVYSYQSFFSGETGTNHSVILGPGGFEPKELSINVGDTVIFSNSKGNQFWPASDLHPTHALYPEFDPMQVVEGNKTWSFKFQKAGTWKYHDHLTPVYTGTIIVGGKGSAKNATKNVETFNIDELFAQFPAEGAPASEFQAWNSKVEGYAKESSVLNISQCSPQPPVVRLNQKQSLVIKNSDTVNHHLIHGPIDNPEIHLEIPSGTEISYEINFPNRGVFGYKCDNKRVGIFFVT